MVTLKNKLAGEARRGNTGRRLLHSILLVLVLGPIVAGQSAHGDDQDPGNDELPAKQATTEPDNTDLLPDVDVGEDIQLGPDGEPLADVQLDGEVDPVTRIAEKMRQVEELLQQAAEETDPKTGPLQEQIVEELDALIKAIKKQQQQQSASGNGSGQDQKNSRSQVKQPNRKQANKTGQKNSNKPSRDSTERLGKATPKIDLEELTEVIKDIWGHLPEKDRERLRQIYAEEVMPGHDVAVEKYFRQLRQQADENDD